MRINNNLSALNANRQLGNNANQVSNRLENLSSGRRINRAADDAAGLAISERMRTQINGARTASRNTQDAISMLQTAEGGLQSMHNMLQRGRELAVQSANGTNQNMDRQVLQGEFGNIVEEIDQTASTLQFNGMTLLDGSQDNIIFHAGPNPGDTVNFNLGAMNAERLLNVEGEYDPETDVNVATAAAATEAIGTVDNAVNEVSMQRAELGAMQNRLEFRMQALDVQAENAAAAESRVGDADMAQMSAQFTAENILRDVSTAILAQANATPQAVLGLIS